jgi:hypothetical protein
MKNLFYHLIAIIAGIFCKLYDDFEDNNYFIDFKNNKFLMEFLKGMHYILFTPLTLYNNLFYLLVVSIILFAYNGDNSSFNNPYEKSLLQSYLLIFLLIDYKKLFNELTTSFNLYILDSLLLLLMGVGSFIESKIITNEVGLIKMLGRYNVCLLCFLAYYFCNTETIKIMACYSFGYCVSSAYIQYMTLNHDINKLIDFKRIQLAKNKLELNEKKEMKVDEFKS